VYSNYNVYSVFQTKNGGTSWQKVAGNLEASTAGTGNAPSVRWISILKFPNGVKKYFAATSIGLFSADSLVVHTNTSGTKWASEGSSVIGNVVCNHIETRSVDGLVVVATHGAGVFAANFEAPNMSKATDFQEIKNLSLFPNPARDIVYWKSDFPFSASAKITIFDRNGRLAKQATAENNTLNVSDLAKGLYIVQWRDGKQQAIRKLLIE
jgi:hypothetical protein